MKEDSADVVRMVPLEDLISHPLLRGLGWSTTRVIRLMIRAGRLKAEVGSRGDVYLSEMSIQRAFYMVKVERTIDLGYVQVLEEEEEPCLDFDSILFIQLARQILGVHDLTFKELKHLVVSGRQYKKSS